MNDAWAVEKELAESLPVVAAEVAEPGLRAFLEEHARLTQRQRQDLETRLRALGKQPSGGKGLFDRMLGRVWDAMQPPRDGIDHTLHGLMKVVGSGQFEMVMYRILEGVARAAGDAETARLAAEHHRQEQNAIERLDAFFKPAVSRAASSPESP